MAGYVHGKTLKKVAVNYTPEQRERLQLIQELSDETLELRERAIQSEKRYQQRRLEAALELESQLEPARIKQAFNEAKAELEKLQQESPQPPGVGAKRMARFIREENAYKAEKATRSMLGGSYDIAA